MADITWPLPNRFKPQIDGFALTAPNLTRRTEFDDGDDRVRRTASQRTTRFTVSIDIELGDMAVLRRWVEEDLDQGRLWFNLTAFVDDGYREIEARLLPRDNGLFEARLVDEVTWRVSFGYEVRALPRIEDEAYFTALVGGPDQADALFTDFNNALFFDLRDATA